MRCGQKKKSSISVRRFPRDQLITRDEGDTKDAVSEFCKFKHPPVGVSPLDLHFQRLLIEDLKHRRILDISGHDLSLLENPNFLLVLGTGRKGAGIVN